MFVELNELCRRLDLSLDYHKVSELYAILVPASENIIKFRFNDSQQLYSVIKKLEIAKDLSCWSQLFHDQRVNFDWFNDTEIRCNKPDICIHRHRCLSRATKTSVTL